METILQNKETKFEVTTEFSAIKVSQEQEEFHITPSQEKTIRKLFVIWRYKKKFQKDLKRAKVRLMIIRELMKTEETYVSKLQLINETLKVEMSRLLQNEEAILRLFNNIEQIQKLSQDMFLKYLKEQTVDLKFNSKVFDREVLKIIPFFKIYSDYLQRYEDSIKYISQLIETKKEVKEYIEEFEIEHESVQSLLITPVQRLPRYRLLFTELANKTPIDHQDYSYIKRCLSEFEGVCTQVNTSIQRYLDNQKIFELTVAFKGNNLQLIEKRREFVFEERLTLINEGEKNCIVSFLNDLILVQERIDEENTKPLCWAFLNQISQVKSCEDMKYFKHIFKVSGVNCILTFMAESKEQKAKLIDQIQLLITNNRQRESDLDNIEVNILGTEEWNTTKIKKFTVYVAEIKIINVTLKIWVRHSQLAQLERKIKSYIKDIQLNHLSTTAFSWLSNNRTRTIENRKIQFEAFLKRVLTMKEIKNSPIIQTVLSDLGLPKEFYDLPYRSASEVEAQLSYAGLKNFESDGSEGEEDEEQNDNQDQGQAEGAVGQSKIQAGQTTSQIHKSMSVSGVKLNKSNIIKEKSQSIVAIGKFSASETFKLHRLKNAQMNRASYHGADAPYEGDCCLLDIELMDESKQQVEINGESRCFSVCLDIAKKIGLKSFLDYRLFLRDSRGNIRVLDEDEILFKTLFPQEKSLQSNALLIRPGNLPEKQSYLNSPVLTPSLSSPAEKTEKLDSSSQKETLLLSSSKPPSAPNVDSLKAANHNSKSTFQSPLWQYTGETIESQNIWQKFVSALRQNEKYTIVFKKYLWLSPEQEEYDIRQDPVRLRLVCYQIFENVREQRYKFGFKDYTLFAGLYLYIKHNEIAKQILQNQKSSTSPPLGGSSPNSMKPSKPEALLSRASIMNIFSPSTAFVFPVDKIKEIIPEIIFNSKEEAFWVEQTIQTLEAVSKEVEKISMKNKEAIEVSKSKIMSQSKLNNMLFDQSNLLVSQDISELQQSKSNEQNQPLENQGNQDKQHFNDAQPPSGESKPTGLTQDNTNCPSAVLLSQSDSENQQKIARYTSKSILSEKIKLMQMVVINAIKDNKLFGVSQFYVNTYKDTLKVAKELNLNIPENVWLGIKHDMVYLLGPEFKEVLLSFDYKDLSSKRVFPKQIHLTLSSVNKDLKFNTAQSFEISQLISEYQTIVSLFGADNQNNNIIPSLI